MHIPFNRPFPTGTEAGYVAEAIERGHLSMDGEFTKRCSGFIEQHTGSRKVLLTHSCTAALEMSAILSGIEPGDEVIMPSFTFVTTANSFVLRGAVPVFVDVRPDTLNIDETLIEAAITPKTRAIVPVHYAGVGCDMDAIMEIARRHDLLVVEDAAQCLMSTYKGQELGTFGELGTLSFHETKNVTCGEGGALMINDEALVERAEIIREKGTNRSRFLRGQVDKYTWVDIGSSHGLSELAAAFLYGQLMDLHTITERRVAVWNRYNAAFADAEARERVRRPIVPPECRHNGHLYYLLMPTADVRNALLQKLNEAGVNAVFHYVPLHSAPGGLRYGRTGGSLERTDDLSARLLRLPLYGGIADEEVDKVVSLVCEGLDELGAGRTLDRSETSV